MPPGPGPRTSRRPPAAIAAMALGVVASGCGLVHEPIVIPEGAQVVHVMVSEERVVLAPDSVRAGEVYFVNEGPEAAFDLLSSLSTPEATAAPFTPEQVDRVARGDLQGTMSDGIVVSCDREWSATDHWRDCGENARRTLAAGLYVVSAGEKPGLPPVMAVLEVTP